MHPGSVTASVGATFTSPPSIIVFVFVLLVVLLIGRVLLALAWRLVLVALVVLVVLWLLGAIGLYPL